MKMPRPTTIDFESKKINGRPAYPPIPVGVSIKKWGKKSRYYAWAHPTKNNCRKSQAIKALKIAYKTPDGILCHNTKFDIDVAETHLKLPRLHWSKYHDTVFLLFLDNPHENNFGLKPSAERLLGWAPEERDAVKDWLLTNQPVPGIELVIAKNPKNPTREHWAGYISEAPGDLVGAYANGDTDRTEGVFKFLWPSIKKRKMLEAYNRERELMPILLENERQGIRVNLNRLKKDIKMYKLVLIEIEAWIRRITFSPKLEIDPDTGEIVKVLSAASLVEALAEHGYLNKDKLGFTPTGKYKADKDSLKNAISDPVISTVLRYRAQLNTCVNTFMNNWLQTAITSGGFIYTWWNQTKNERGGGSVGARTGRLSSTPNFQNIPNPFEFILPKGRLKGLTFLKKLPPLPVVRSYIIPWNKDHVLIDRDYSQQELRILGHFEGGVLLQAYIVNPWLDVHEHARVLISELLNKIFKRKPIKNTGFGIIYGMGLGLLAKNSEITVDKAREVRNAYLAIFPGLKEMNKEMKRRAKNDEPIRTWGGREYYCEPPKVINGRVVTFEYKMLNVLIQGSAADCTKQAIINHSKIKGKNHRVYLNVHDEVLLSVPKSEIRKAMLLMQQAMEDVKFAIPMLSEGDYSTKNWAALKPYDKKGVIKYAA